MREVTPGKTYRHFKGMLVNVICIAFDSETKQRKVVYDENNQIWVRDYEMFTSEVDKEKYPNVTQKYRFEEVTQ